VSELARIMEEFFPELYTTLLNDNNEDFDALAIMKLSEKDKEGALRVTDVQIKMMWDVMRQGTRDMDLGLLISSSLYTAMILGVFLGERMKARVTLEEEYHKEN